MAKMLTMKAHAAYEDLKARQAAGTLKPVTAKGFSSPVYLTGVNTQILTSLKDAGLIDGRLFLGGKVVGLVVK